MPIRLHRLIAAAMLILATAGATPPGGFHAAVHPIAPEQRAKMTGRSWTKGCPVLPRDLVAIDLTFIGFDGAVHDGQIVIHRRLADETIDIFHALFDQGFRIERMQPYEDFPVGKYAASNDTVGFYCRPAQDDPSAFSWHAYGMAVDINPMTNPYHDPKEGWWPSGSAANAPRDRTAPGILTLDSKAVGNFLGHGWAWGGIYRENPDYMHFGKVTYGASSNPLDRPIWAERLVLAPP